LTRNRLLHSAKRQAVDRVMNPAHGLGLPLGSPANGGGRSRRLEVEENKKKALAG